MMKQLKKQTGMFDESDVLRRLTALGDRLEWLDSVMDWGVFRPLLVEMKPDRSGTEKGGRKPWDVLMMFKVAILKELFGVSDDAAEFQINDRLSWKRFLGLGFSDKSPDAKTIWEFGELLTNSGMYDRLFSLFNEKLEGLGVITRRGTIVDASFVDVPKQRNTKEENKTIKEGGIPEAWEEEDQKNKLAQKDLDAEWAKKGDETHYGYKDHVSVDADSKIILDWRVTGAAVHDSRMFLAVLDLPKTKEIWADSAYMSEKVMEYIKKHYPKIKLHINEKGYKNHPLTDEQKANNREKSRTRCRIEHVFGHMTQSCGGMFMRKIGGIRAEGAVVMKNLAYNISRYATLCKLKKAPIMA